MLNITLKELREEEFASVEKVTYDISAKMKGSNILMPTQLFGMAYLAYLVADNGIENVEELIEYVEKELPVEQSLFVREAVKDAWSVAIDIGVSYTTETLVATLLWMPISNGRYGAEMETPAGSRPFIVATASLAALVATATSVVPLMVALAEAAVAFRASMLL